MSADHGSTASDRQPLLVGSGTEVPVIGGPPRPYVNLDYAASAPALRSVAEQVEALLPWYSSVHRGAGFKSRYCTAAYEGARAAVLSFVGARPDDVLIFTRNTTDGLNLLATAVPDGSTVIAFECEHHANLLPWRRHKVRYLPTPSSPADLLAALDRALATTEGPAVVALTGAPNVTGEVWPIAQASRVAHRYDARVVLDAAQLAPHRPVDMAGMEVDYLVLSGHKLYAPYGAGALVGRRDWLDQAEPYLAGGGAVEFVTLDDVLWKVGAERHEAGSPNVVGAIALGLACDALADLGMERVAAEEERLHAAATAALRRVPGLRLYSMWLDEPHVGIVTFNLDGYHHALLASILSAEFGIGVRHGCFCAHPYVTRLLEIGPDVVETTRRRLAAHEPVLLPGAVRMSMGLDTRESDITALAGALDQIARSGPAATYVERCGEYEPEPDPRRFPDLGIRLTLQPPADSSCGA